MSNIDWRAFWVSVGTMTLTLVFFFIVIEPLIRKYKIQVVSDEDKPKEVKAAA